MRHARQQCPIVLLFALVAGCAADNAPEDAAEPHENTHMLWVTDRGLDRVVAFDERGRMVDVVVDEGLDRPSSAERGPDGAIYVASFGQAAVLRFDPTTREQTRFYDDANLEEPVQLLFRDHELCVLGNDTRNVLILSPDGRVQEELHPLPKSAHDFVIGPDGSVYIASAPTVSGATVQAWDVGRGSVDDVVLASTVAHATSLTFGANDELIVSDYVSGDVAIIDEAGAVMRLTGAVHPLHLAIGPDGLLYVLEDRGITRWDLERGVELDVLVAPSAELEQPRSFTFVALD